MTMELPDSTEPGFCHLCGAWTNSGRVIAEIPGNAGAGDTVVRCAACVTSPRRRPRRRDASEPRRYSA